MSAPPARPGRRAPRARCHPARRAAVAGVAALAVVVLSGCDPVVLAAGPGRGPGATTTTTTAAPTTTPRPTTTPAPTTAPTGTTPGTTAATTAGTTPSRTSPTRTSPTRPPVTTTATAPAPGGGGTPAPPAGAPPAGAVPAPGQVGHRGSESDLQVIDATHPGPAGTRFSGGVLQVTGSSVVLDGVLVRGGIDFGGSGTLTIRDSVVEGNRSSYSPIMGRNPAGHVLVSDTTIRWRAGDTGPARWGNGAIHGDSRFTVVRCDISGTPDGIQTGSDGSLFEQNHIHDLAVFGSYPDNTHNDGIQSYGGRDVTIRYNRIDIRDPAGRAYDGTHQNAALFFMPDSSSPSVGLQVVGNFLAGGGYTLRLGSPMTGAVVADNRFGPTTGGFGDVTSDGARLSRWSGNTDAAGRAIAQP